MTSPPIIQSQSPPNIWWLAGAGAVLAAAVVLYFFDPTAYGFYPRCRFHSMTGLYCPGCGGLRGLHQLFHGHVLAALRMNPLIFILPPALGGIYFWRHLNGGHVAKASGALGQPVWGGWWLIVLVLFWILRNIPLYPFTLLAP